MQGQVVGPGEGAVALGAAKRLDPRVLPEVPGQLVGAGEAPGAALPGAVVGFLSWKGAGQGCVKRHTTRTRTWRAQDSPVWILLCALRCELLV